MRVSLPVLVAVVLVIPALSGCLGGGPRSAADPPGSPADQPPAGPEESRGIHVPPPSNGSRYVYTSQEGKALAVRVDGVGDRTDAWLRDRTAILLNLTYWPDGRGDRSFTFEEAIDPESGLVVAQWARCGAWEKRGQPRDRVCMDERGKWIGAAMGLPGGNGAAPLWATNVTPGSLNRSLPTVLGMPDRWRVQLAGDPAPGASGDCLIATPDDAGTAWARGLRFTGGLDRFRVCEGLALPVEFTALGGTRYRLENHTLADGDPVRANATPLGGSPDPPVELEDRAFPVFIASPGHESPFPVREAHEAALERSEDYRALFRSGPDGTLVETMFTGTGSSQSMLASSETYEHGLIAVDAAGRQVAVTVQKTVEEGVTTMGEQETSYEVTEERGGTVQAPFPTRSTLMSHQASLGDAIEVGHRLTEQPYDEWYWMYRKLKGATWLLHENPMRTRGPTLVVFFTDPSPIDETGGLRIENPYEVAVDSPSGALLWVEANRTTLRETLR